MITLAVLYNLTVVVGRAVFWELDNMFPSGWMVTDIILMLLLLMMMMMMMMIKMASWESTHTVHTSAKRRG